MNSKLNLFWVCVAIMGLSGCASMSGDECMTSDWSAIGYEDGSRGYTSDRFGQHRKACAKHGVTPDFSAYQTGREQGLVEYCQPHRGFSIGSNGGRYNGVCSVNQEAGFLDAYNAGRHLYTLQSNVNRANSSIYNKEKELDKIEHQLVANGAAMIAPETSNEDRVHLLLEMKQMSERTGVLQAEIKDLHAVRARNQIELEQYQIYVADMGY